MLTARLTRDVCGGLKDGRENEQPKGKQAAKSRPFDSFRKEMLSRNLGLREVELQEAKMKTAQLRRRSR